MQVTWYDWITPTTPFLLILVGLVFVVCMVTVIWLDTKNYFITGVTLLLGSLILLLSILFIKGLSVYIEI